MGRNNVLAQGCLLLGLLCGLTGCFPFSFWQPAPEKLDVSELLVGVTPTAPPLIYKEGDRIVGLEAELARAFGDALGMPVRFVELNLQEQIPALEKGKVDIVMSGMVITQPRSARIDFCDPYFRVGQMLLVDIANGKQFPRGYYDLKWKKDIRVGVVEASPGDDFARRNLPEARVTGYKNADAAVTALVRGHIDGFLADAPMVAYAAALHESKGVVPVYHLLTEEYLAWGVRKEDKVLQRRANGFLKQYAEDGRLESSLRKWMPYLN